MIKNIYKRIYSKFYLKSDCHFYKNLLIDPDHLFAYIQIPKAACSTIKYNMMHYTGVINKEGITQRELHDNSRYWMVYGDRRFAKFFSNKNIKYMFVFTFVRNPYARVLSAYREKIELRLDGNKYRLDLGLPVNINVSFNEFLDALRRKKIQEYDQHFLPQYCIVPRFIRETAFIGAVECINSDMELLAEKIFNKKSMGLTSRVEHTTASSKHEIINEYFNDDVLSKFMEIYQDDFDIFGYSKKLEDIDKPPLNFRRKSKENMMYIPPSSIGIYMKIDMYLNGVYHKVKLKFRSMW